MEVSLLHIKKAGRYCYLFFILILTDLSACFAQSYPLPVLPDTSALGQYTSRTMNLLHSSTPDLRNEVRILVYGQSISEQEWWLEVKRTVEKRFPDAQLVMENKAIGGFSTQYLFKTVEMDVSAFYPDLVLLHIYGNSKDYETVVSTIRSRTTSEIAIMTDHFIGENKWSDTMSYFILPALADKYKCDILNIRDPWKTYLKDNNLEPSALLKDGIHLNDFGNFLMAELVKPLFCFKPSFPDDPFGLLSYYKTGKDLLIRDDTLTLLFKGNRADLVYAPDRFGDKDSLKIILDGKAPAAFQGTYFMTRPYNSKGEAWPWQLPGMIRISHTAPWINEEWTCIYTKAVPPFSDVKFRIRGSVTGPDGHGSVSKDFVSGSGRVIINKDDAEKGGDWHLNRSYKVLKTIVRKGDTLKWRTYSLSHDFITFSSDLNTTGDMGVTLFQGVPNTGHVLKITGTEEKLRDVSFIKVYRPYWGR